MIFMIRKLLFLFLSACFFCTAPSQVQAEDIWAFSTPGEEFGPDRNIPDDHYVDTNTIKWINSNEFTVKTKIVLNTGKYVGDMLYHFYRHDDNSFWVYAIGDNAKVPSSQTRQVSKESMVQSVFNVCLCEKARSQNYVPNTNDITFKRVKGRLDQFSGTLYDGKGYSVSISDMKINGYQILEAYDLAGGDPGCATIIIRQPHGCRAAKISWLTHSMDGEVPYFEIDDVRYQY